MQKNNLIFRILTVVLVLGFMASCKKNDEVKPATQEDFASAHATLDVIAEVENLNDMALAVSQENSGDERARKAAARRASSKESVCGTYTYTESEAGAVLLTVDFGTGQTCEDNITRKGKLIYTIASSGTAISVQFVGYEANGNKLDGNYSLALSYGEDENFVYKFKFEDAVLTKSDKSKVQWDSEYTLTMKWVAPATEEDFLAIEMETTGGISGVGADGKSFSATITTPLFITSNCAYGLTKGTYLIKTQGHPDAVVDYGNGACDNTATLTINGKSEAFDLDN